MLIYILIGILLAVIVYMLWSVIGRQGQMKREDRYYTENIYPVVEYPAYNGWWWPGTSVIYGTGGWWRPPYWRGLPGMGGGIPPPAPTVNVSTGAVTHGGGGGAGGGGHGGGKSA